MLNIDLRRACNCNTEVIDGTVLSATKKKKFPVNHVDMGLYRLLTEHLPGNMKRGDATNFNIEMPSQTKKDSLFSTFSQPEYFSYRHSKPDSVKVSPL